MSRNIVATEEICQDLGLSAGGTARQVAERLSVSVSTARRHLFLLVERGWVKKGYDMRTYSDWYSLTERGWDAFRSNEGL